MDVPLNPLQKQVDGCSVGGWNSCQAGRVVVRSGRTPLAEDA